MLRRGRPDDAAVLADILRRAMDDAVPGLPKLHTPDEDRWFLRELVLAKDEVWVWEENDQPVGFLALGTRDGEDFLQHLYVAPEHQGRGIGRALFAKAKELRPRGFKWWVFQRNPARAFYEREGGVVLELTDGQANEEKEPDALYGWAP